MAINNIGLPDRFVALDSWRGIAACIIALIHFHVGVNNHVSELSFFGGAFLFVDFFFALSGFVIFANYARRLRDGFGFWRFMWLRLGRLYPLHIAILLVFIGFEWIQVLLPGFGALAVNEPFSQEGESLQFIAANIILVHALGFFNDGIQAFNQPSWSISTEFYSYALFAVLLIVLKRRVAIITALLVVFCTSFFILSAYEIYMSTTTQYGFIRCVMSFSAGAMLWYFYESFQSGAQKFFDRPLMGTLFEVLSVLAVVAFISCGTSGQERMFAPFFFVPLIFIFSFEKGLLSRLLRYRFFVALGVLSYSIYMTHAFIAGKAAALARYIAANLSIDVTAISDTGEAVLGKTIWQGDMITLFYLSIVVGVSCITYKLVEEPGRKASRNLAKKWGKPAASPSKETALKT